MGRILVVDASTQVGDRSEVGTSASKMDTLEYLDEDASDDGGCVDRWNEWADELSFCVAANAGRDPCTMPVAQADWCRPGLPEVR